MFMEDLVLYPKLILSIHFPFSRKAFGNQEAPERADKLSPFALLSPFGYMTNFLHASRKTLAQLGKYILSLTVAKFGTFQVLINDTNSNHTI